MAKTLTISLRNDINELPNLTQLTEVFLEPLALPSKVTYAVNLALEEILVNIINYGYDDEETHEIDVRLDVDQEEIAVTIEDDAREFNPLTVSPPDRSKSALERIEGGLGIHFVRHMRDLMEYRREEGKNILKIWFLI